MTDVKATKQIEDLLADPAIDVVDLCVPTAAHPDAGDRGAGGGQARHLREAAGADLRPGPADRRGGRRRPRASSCPPCACGSGRTTSG